MTLTNNIRDIEALAGTVVIFCDERDYVHAHSALDDIEKKVHEVHRHIDHLQNVTDFCARPAGED